MFISSYLITIYLNSNQRNKSTSIFINQSNKKNITKQLIYQSIIKSNKMYQSILHKIKDNF